MAVAAIWYYGPSGCSDATAIIETYRHLMYAKGFKGMGDWIQDQPGSNIESDA
jgi:hypothetical protein